ncbi:MAG: 23S rRNA (guanosine(2251)-2'-O)-methyltransferase RlmB, partial [Proteobacteria bacterium]|nr:23S rRNA (guanosine(2251)-2'-O)-methyltransferase RlmB [Pseudomonadota bacterium]
FGEGQFAEGRPARFSGKRETKRPRNFHQERIAHETNTVIVQTQEDGWLVGHHAVYAALASGRRKVRNVWLMAEAKGPLAELLAQHPEWPVETKTRPEFEAQFGEAVHQGVAALVGNLSQPSLPELLAQKPRLLVALDQVTDPHNLGAIVRSCAAFGAQGVIVTEHRAAGLSATAAKVAAGAMETVPVVEVTNLVQALNMLKEANFTTIGLAGEATQSIYETTQNLATRPPVCLVVGSEGDGLRRLTRENCDALVQIPTSPTVESLNVSVATGVALSILTRGSV